MMSFIGIFSNKIVHTYCRFHAVTTFSYPFHILFLNICLDIRHQKGYLEEFVYK